MCSWYFDIISPIISSIHFVWLLYAVGYELMGMESGEECYCGKHSDDPFRYGLCSNTGCRCDHRCPGNIQQICGGGWALSLYSIGMH